MTGLLSRWFGRRKDAAAERVQEEEQMSPAERAFVDESVEDHEADEFVEGQLGGIDPDRLLGDEGRPRDD